jgi:hypothetical protein
MNDQGKKEEPKNDGMVPKEIHDEVKKIADEAAVGTKSITLPSGKIATIKKFLGRDIREAQKICDGESDMLVFAIIAVTTTIDGLPILAEDIDFMPGEDVMQLMQSFGSNFTSRQNK